VDIDEELLNRCLILTVDEGRAQTAAIHRTQRERETLDGLLRAEARAAVLAVHRNAQRLLRSLRVVNPYAEQLTFLDDRTRTRRDHTKYLALIRTIALLHQHQRPIRTVERNGVAVEYIEATLDDIAAANRLAHDILGRSLDDLAPQTRRFLTLLRGLVTQRCAERNVDRSRVLFTQRDARAFTGWTDFQVKTHLRKLVDLEYVLTHRGDRGQSFVYELLYDGDGLEGRPHLSGLLDVAALRTAKREHAAAGWEHRKGDREHPESIQGAPREHGGSAPKNRAASSEKSSPSAQPRGNAHQDGASAAA
ncbi:MAG: DNA primase, partial [Opitutaceae bacterium]